MHLLSYLLTMIVCITTNHKLSNPITSYQKPNLALQTLQANQSNSNSNTSTDTEQDTPSDSLDEILKKDSHSGGAIQNILGGLALCYNVLANLLLYPIFSFLLLLLSAGAIVLFAFWIKKVKSEKSISTIWILFTCLYSLFYLNLFLVVYQKKEILFLFLELEKDLFLTIVAASMGYMVGKFFSSKSLEEKQLP